MCLVKEIKEEMVNRLKLYKRMKDHFNKENYKGGYTEEEREKAYEMYKNLYYEVKDIYENIEYLEYSESLEK